jgi:phage terminase large subunit GpA-like protein
MSDPHFSIALGDICSPYVAFRSPRRVSVSEGAAQVLVIKQPGGYVGPWSPTETPYMVEPMDRLASRRHEAVCFVGPARTGKTMGLLDGWIAHVVVNDPGDAMIVQMTQDKAREFSKVRVDRMLRHSPALAALKSASAQDDNTHDKSFRHGMWLRIAWPTVSNLSGSDYRYVGLTDYDRMPDDIDGEGAPFALALKRTQTFLSRGMCMVESSPGRERTDPNWRPATAHEAPPTGGVLGIYNQSDRHRWYWRCLDCREWYEAAPGLGLFNLPSDDELLDMVREADLDALAGQYARVVCPHCGSIVSSRHKHELNLGGRWVADGQSIVGDGELVGTAMQSSIAGYWLGGVAAAYQGWKSLVLRYLQGLRDYTLTGNELQLQTTTNTDQGMPYLSRHLIESSRTSGRPGDSREDLQRFVVPDETRFLVAAVDVQGGSTARFVVQVHAVGPHLEQWLVDRYELRESERDGMGGKAPIDPAGYAEDWDILTERVVRSTYRTSQDGRELKVKITAVDSGGEDGVTDRAYAWYRRLRREGLHTRVMLVKGASTKTAPLIRESWVGAKGTKTSKGDIPIYLLNPNLLKDMVSTGLRRRDPGPGFIHWPEWLPKAFFDELNAEVRLANGGWQQVRKRNEAFDLAAYVRAACLRLGADKIKNWDVPPGWATPLFSNPELVTREDRRASKENTLVRARPAARRVTHSPYLT